MPAEIRFRLAQPLPSLNALMRTSKYEYKQNRETLAWEVVSQINRQRPAKPFVRAELIIERHSVGELDEDNLKACRKVLTDVLQPASRRHPNGLGVILNDDPAHLKATVLQVRVRRHAEQHTLVTIRDLGESL